MSLNRPMRFYAGHLLFSPRWSRPPTQEMTAFIDAHKIQHGIEPICKQLPIAILTYYAHKVRESDLEKASARSICDRNFKPEIQRVWDENLQIYDVRKIWRQLKREGYDVARCSVERLMKQLGIELGVVIPNAGRQSAMKARRSRRI